MPKNTQPDGPEQAPPNPNLAWARAYARDLAWHVFPVNQRSKAPHSCLGPDGGFLHATTDLGQIDEWWTKYPNANIGLNCLASGVVAVDIDSWDAKPGEATWTALVEEHGPLPPTVECITGSGSRHLLFAAPDGVSFPGSLGPGIELKHNGYIILPPSRVLIPAHKGPYGWKESPLD